MSSGWQVEPDVAQESFPDYGDDGLESHQPMEGGDREVDDPN